MDYRSIIIFILLIVCIYFRSHPNEPQIITIIMILIFGVYATKPKEKGKKEDHDQKRKKESERD